MFWDCAAEKRGGAWMDEVVGQSRLLAPPGQKLRLPVAHMVRPTVPCPACQVFFTLCSCGQEAVSGLLRIVSG